MTTFCMADEIATAIVTAARLEGENPEAIARGAQGSRARWYAFAALVDAFPSNDYRAIAVGVGIFTQSTMVGSRALLASYRRGKGPSWWDEAKVDAVREALARLATQLVIAAHPVSPRVQAASAGDPAPSLPAPAPCVFPEDAPLGKNTPTAPPILPDRDSIPTPRRARAHSSCGDVTGAVLGDPPPERSALARKRGAAA